MTAEVLLCNTIKTGKKFCFPISIYQNDGTEMSQMLYFIKDWYSVSLTWAKLRKKSCLWVRFRPGSGGSSLYSDAHFKYAWYAAFKPPLSAIFSPEIKKNY